MRKRSKPIAALSFAAIEESGIPVGSIHCWPVRIGDFPIVLVGPVAVTPELQGKGLGHKLMHAMLEAAQQMGDPVMVMIGDPEYQAGAVNRTAALADSRLYRTSPAA